MKINHLMLWFWFSLVAASAWSSDHCRTDQIVWSLAPEIHEHSTLHFYDRPGNLGHYLSLELSYQAVKPIYELVKTNLSPNLKSRGEAHITVLTPVEYRAYFDGHVDVNELKAMIAQFEHQSLNFELKSMGSGSLRDQQGNIKAQTFFIIISSQDLIELRYQLATLLPSSVRINFKPEHFYGHITVGFIQRDLHEADGVIKDEAHSKDDRFCLMP